MPNFSILEDGVSHTATVAGSLLALDPAMAAVTRDVMIDNPGPNDVRVRAGSGGVVATTSSMRVPAGTVQAFNKGGATHLAFKADGGDQAVVVILGEGD